MDILKYLPREAVLEMVDRWTKQSIAEGDDRWALTLKTIGDLIRGDLTVHSDHGNGARILEESSEDDR